MLGAELHLPSPGGFADLIEHFHSETNKTRLENKEADGAVSDLFADSMGAGKRPVIRFF